MSPKVGADNLSGFTSLPGGARGSSLTFGDIGMRGWFWSSTQDPANIPLAWCRYLAYNGGNLSRVNVYKEGGISVRCVKD